jgi:NAD-dependent dihydropyrimidine dehydrogenase PreA subunit
VLRLLPHAVAPGLQRIGDPGADSPVLLTCNFALTVRRLTQVLRDRDVWLLVANSKGINVWCAAGGGHLSDHEVIAAIRASELGRRVSHRRLILPQLAATGVQPGKVERATGFKCRWGPARLEDLPEFFAQGCRTGKRRRRMRFPLWERMEMSAMWIVPMAAVVAAIVGLLAGWTTGLAAAAMIAVTVGTIFAALPRLPVAGPASLLTYLGFGAAGAGAGIALLAAFAPVTTTQVVILGCASAVAMAVLYLDLAGTTPWYPSNINTMANAHRVELVAERCRGAACCVLVCPREVLQMAGAKRKVVIAQPDACLRCGACIVQCPQDALRFRFDDGQVVEAPAVRSTKLNLLGRRTVPVPGAGVTERDDDPGPGRQTGS